MKESLVAFWEKIGLLSAAEYAAEAVMAIIAVAICLAAYYLIKIPVIGGLKRAANKSKYKWLREFWGSKAVLKAIRIIPAVVMYRLTGATPLLKETFDIILIIYIVFMSLSFVNAVIDSVNRAYDQYYRDAKAKPIKGLLTALKIIFFAVALIIVLSRILGQSPIYILSGLGALSAITMLIFKDTILGFVAGFQMSSNDLVRIGDWIEMPKYGADGDVIDITLTFVKVRNWDKTIVTIPAYALVSDSFKNWRGMFATGGRRIKRAMYIDVSSVGFCTPELLESLSKVELIKGYLGERQAEIDNYNKERGVDVTMPVNGRHMTNIGVFRRYITEYLNRHPQIHKEMVVMVRQLQTENAGIPLEIYAFTNDTKWVNYEGIMSDIFDHLYAAVEYFELKIFQEPAGSDIRSLSSAGRI